ncbi:FHA domain-containing protein [Mycena kentingensis (nom. inval.)]|nr:FHA domain-containing protein [Mycena kentingensis (nom. inval.)]
MATPNPFPQQNSASFPALHLYPLDDSFVPKRIALGGPAQRVKIARPPNTKTQPGQANGYFDSRVLSRQHAEVWEEDGKIWIKDVKSSNGTFLNGERLSPEGRESEPCELKTEDILEFGVDIVSEDNKTILHRKVVARVACVFPGQPIPLVPEQYSNGSATFNGNGMAGQRRPPIPMIHQGLAGLGGMGGGVRVPGRGLTLDHIFSRLQAELAKSRDTGHDLQVLTGALNGIEDTLNGALPPSDGPPRLPGPDALPPVRPAPPARSMTLPALPVVPPVENPQAQVQADAIAELQAQLREHQRALAAHVESIRALESVLAEQDAMKREVQELRQFVGVDRRFGEEAKDEGEDDEDDARSIVTAVAQDMVLERVEEVEDEHEDAALHEESQIFDSSTLGPDEEREEQMLRERAQTPEPSLEETPEPQLASELTRSSSPPSSSLSLGELTARLAVLTDQLETALATSSELQAQHASAQATIVVLEEKLARLEAKADDPPAPAPPAPVVAPTPAPVTVTLPSAELEDMQAQLSSMRAELAAERNRREAWTGAVDEKIRLAAESVSSIGNGHAWTSSRSSSPSRGSEKLGTPPPAYIGNGVVKTERSLSSDPMSMQTAVGVLVLGIAAAAVLWRVKPE